MFQRQDPTALQKNLEEMTSKGGFQSDNSDEWQPTKDAQGNASAVIRFLPTSPNFPEQRSPFAKLHSHGFKNGGKWFIENCPTSIGEKCPVCDANGELWETGIESNKDIARTRKRKLSYWANILVIKDEANPENEGKVFKYRFGKKIMDKIQAMANPETDLGEEAVDVTCVFGGANFLLKVKKVSGFPNYDDSKFGTPAPIKKIDDEDFQKKLLDEMHDLTKITASDQFKSYEDLQKGFNKVTGNTAAAKSAASMADSDASSDFDKELDGYDSQSTSNDKVDTSSESSGSQEPDDDLDDLLKDL